MPEIIHLDKSAGWINVGSSGMRIQAPGLHGDILWRPPLEHAPLLAESAALPDRVEDALREAGLSDQGSLTVSAGTASFAAPPARLLLDVPLPDEQIQFAIYRDESGVISLHQPLRSLPSASLLTADATARLVPRYHYIIPLRRAATLPGGPPRMAMLGGIVGKIIRLVGRAATALPREAVHVAAKTWEDNFRKPQGFHWCRNLPELSNPAPPQMSPADLSSLQDKKVLLFVHGTISSTNGAFGSLAGFQVEATRLFAKYGNNAIGFNHHTLTKSVSANAVDFLSALPPGNYKFDVISHSRGGLLARALKELTPAQLKQLADSNITIDPGVNVQLDRIVVVGTPNQGTPLANPADLPKAISRLASVATSFNQDAAELGLGALFAIFVGIVEGGVAALPGLEDMNPGNPFLKLLNSSSTDISPYYGIAADFLATGGLAAAILDDGFDALFSGVANDLVVPTAGVANINGAVLSSARLDEYARSAGVFHTDYFRQQETWDKINGFLV